MDPQKGIVIPRYDPPVDLSPAAMGYIQDMTYSDHLFSSTLIHLAVKKHIKIDERKGQYTFTKLNSSKAKLSPEEKVVLSNMFRASSVLVITNGGYQRFMAKAKTAFEDSMEYVYQKVFFRR